MPKKLFKKYLPHQDTITQNKWVKKLGPRLQEPRLWHINRKSCSGGAALGIFCAFIPIPFQTLLVAIGAIAFRYNILIAVPIVWISNPITLPPIFYFCYQVGAWLLDIEPSRPNFEYTSNWPIPILSNIWQPFLFGCLAIASVCALAAFTGIRLLWRYHIYRHIKKRNQRRHQSA